MDIAWVPVGVAFVAACVGAVTDVWKRRVYNVLTLPLAVSGLAYHACFAGWEGVWDSSLGLFFGFGVLLVPWLLGLVGAGDVKLMAGVGSWLGMPASLLAFAVASLAAGVYGLVLIVLRGKLSESVATVRVIFYRFVALGNYLRNEDLVEQLSTGKDSRFRVLPFGAMVPLGIIGAVLWLRLVE